MNTKVDVSAWSAKIVTIKSISRNYSSYFTDVCGLIRLLPHWDCSGVSFDGKNTYPLDIYFETEARMKSEDASILENLELGTHIIVDGELSPAYYISNEEFKSHKTKFIMLKWHIDVTKGKKDANAAMVESSNLSEYSSALSLRFSNLCSFCSSPFVKFNPSGQNFCNSCRV